DGVEQRVVARGPTDEPAVEIRRPGERPIGQVLPDLGRPRLRGVQVLLVSLDVDGLEAHEVAIDRLARRPGGRTPVQAHARVRAGSRIATGMPIRAATARI